MRYSRIITPVLAVLLFGAGCSSAALPTPTPQPGTQTPTAPPAAQVPFAPDLNIALGTVTVKFSGDATKEGTFPARCAPYFPAQNKGVVFESQGMDGWTLQIGDYENRNEGPQVPSQIGILNGPEASYVIDPEGAQVNFGPGLKSATVKAKFRRIMKDGFIDVEATFACN